MNKSHSVFISYARRDGSQHAEKLDSLLQVRGFKTWRDKRGIVPWQDFTSEIERAIDFSSCVISCITLDTRRDESFVRREIGYALLLQKPVIVARFSDVVPPISIVNNTWIDFFRNWDEGFNQLCIALGQLSDSPEIERSSDRSNQDPYRDYLEALYKNIVHFLAKTIFTAVSGDSSHKLISLETVPISITAAGEQKVALPTAFFDMAGPETTTEEGVYSNFHQIFEKYDGRLLLLGEPGSGKTTTMMAFARDAVAKRLANSSNPVPLLAPIATWNAYDATINWLSRIIPMLNEDTIVRLMKQQEAVLLLDGLDELGSIWKCKEFVREVINKLPSNIPVVVSCRVQEYNDIRIDLTFRGAVKLQPLNDNQVTDCLSQQTHLLSIVERDKELKEILRNPLLLNLFMYAYEVDSGDIPDISDLRDSPVEWRNHIVEAYVKRRFEWETRKHRISFSLQELYSIFGQLAVTNVLDRYHQGGMIALSDVPDAYISADEVRRVTNRRYKEFVKLADRLNLFVATDYGDSYRFSHMLFHDFFAFQYGIALCHNRDAQQRIDATRVLSEIGGDYAINLLVSLFKDDDVNVRLAAVFALSYVGEPAAEVLLNLLQASNPLSREHAAITLGKMNYVGSIELLTNLLDDRIEAVRLAAIQALATLGDVRSVSHLLSHLLSESAEIRAAIVTALGSLGDSRAIDPIILMLQDSSVVVCRNATESLGKLGDIVAVEPLIEVLGHKDAQVRVSAIQALGELKDVRAVEPLIEVLGHKDAQVRVSTIQALGKLKDAQAVEPLLNIVLDSEVPIRNDIIISLSSIGNSALPLLLDTLGHDDNWMRYVAMQAIERIGESSIQGLLDRISSANSNIRRNVATLLGQLGDVDVFEKLLELTHDLDVNVRRSSITALGKLQDARAVTRLVELLLDVEQLPFEKRRICDFAVEALERINTAAAKKALDDWKKA